MSGAHGERRGEPGAALVRWLAIASLAAAALTGLAADRAWSSLVDHAPAPLPARAGSPAGPALSPRMLLLLVDGLGQAPARELASLQALAERGAAFTCAASPPTLSRPGRATLLTGVRPHLHGATTNFHQDRPAAAPSLLDGLRGARVWGSKLWPGLFPGGWSGGVHVTPIDIHHLEHREKAAGLFAAERAAVAEALHATFPFAVIDLLGVDSSSHDHGVGSPEQRAALAHVDAMLALLSPAVLDAGGTLVVTADHGHVAEGGHGGDEPEVTAVPLVMAGAGVRPGLRGGTCAHVDVAPTLAALLGVPAPADAEGQALVAALTTAPPAARASAPRASSPGLRSRLATGALAAAAALALLVPGAVVAGARAVASFGLAWAATVAALVSLFGLRLSLSGINDEVLLVPYFERVLLFAALAGLAGAAAAARVTGDRRWVAAAAALVAGQGALLLFAAAVHARYSLVVDGPLDAIGVVFLAFVALVASLGLATLAACAWVARAALERRGR